MAISSSLSAQSIAQSGWQQFRVQQAQRDAERAEQNAAALQSRAADARRSADRAEQNARSLEVQSGQAQSQADQAQRGVAALRTEDQMLTRLGGAYDKVAQSLGVGRTAETTPAKAQTPAPVVNVQGQVTGQLVSVSA